MCSCKAKRLAWSGPAFSLWLGERIQVGKRSPSFRDPVGHNDDHAAGPDFFEVAGGVSQNGKGHRGTVLRTGITQQFP